MTISAAMVRSKERFLRLCAEYLVDSESSAGHVLNMPDWNCFMDVASRHSICPLLYHNLAKSEKHVPSEVIEYLREQYYLNKIRNEFLYSELSRILSALKESEVEVIVLKGAALAETIYCDRGLRPFNDIDILIRRECLNIAEDVLTRLGYTSDTYATSLCFREKERFYYNLRYIKGASVVELHWDLGSNAGIYKYMKIKVDAIWKNAKKSRIAGIDVLIPSPEDLIIHSCIHSAIHRHFSLIWLYDIRQIAEGYQIDWEYLIRSTKSSNITRPVFYGLFFSEDFLGPIIPKRVLYELRPLFFEVSLVKFFRYWGSFSILKKPKSIILRLLFIDNPIDRLRFLAARSASLLQRWI